MRVNFRKIKGFLHRHKWSVFIVGLALMTAAGILYYSYSKNPNFNPGSVLIPKKLVEKVKAPLTGLPLDNASFATRRPFAVVIENSPDARPQSGYNDADIVYETLAEGGITRTMAIFQSKNSAEIGPVRSARLYFIDWLSEVKAIFVHVGGNIDALDEIIAKNIPDLNQFAYGSYFWRATDRFAPHNVYTTTDKLYAAATKAGLNKSVELTWHQFKKDVEEKDRPASGKVTVNFSGPLFTVTWNYDPKNNDYSRQISGVLLKDKKTGEQIKAKNVVVQYENMSPYTTRHNTQAMRISSVGTGKGLLIQDGKTTNITWSKASRDGLTKLTDEGGKEIELNPGITWFEIVPVGQNVTY